MNEDLRKYVWPLGTKSKEFNELLALCPVEDQKLILSNMSSIIQVFIS